MPSLQGRNSCVHPRLRVPNGKHPILTQIRSLFPITSDDRKRTYNPPFNIKLNASSRPPFLWEIHHRQCQKLLTVKYAKIEQMGLCQKTLSFWASPLRLVKKTDGTGLPYRDYRRLKHVTKSDQYCLPN